MVFQARLAQAGRDSAPSPFDGSGADRHSNVDDRNDSQSRQTVPVGGGTLSRAVLADVVRPVEDRDGASG
jgi:hypothetical protein